MSKRFRYKVEAYYSAAHCSTANCLILVYYTASQDDCNAFVDKLWRRRDVGRVNIIPIAEGVEILMGRAG